MMLLAALLAAVMTPTPTPTPAAVVTLPRQQHAPACHRSSWMDDKTGDVCTAVICDDQPMVQMKCEPAITK